MKKIYIFLFALALFLFEASAFTEVVTTPGMSLPVPIPGVTVGPDYANDINACFYQIDQHNHTNGKGVPVPTAGLNINANLPFNGFTATSLEACTFTPVVSLATLDSAYVSGVDLWFNDGNGNTIQITKNGGVNAGNLTGVLPVPNGGTGASTLTGSLVGNGTSPFTAITFASQALLMGASPIAIAPGLSYAGSQGQMKLLSGAGTNGVFAEQCNDGVVASAMCFNSADNGALSFENNGAIVGGFNSSGKFYVGNLASGTPPLFSNPSGHNLLIDNGATTNLTEINGELQVDGPLIQLNGGTGPSLIYDQVSSNDHLRITVPFGTGTGGAWIQSSGANSNTMQVISNTNSTNADIVTSPNNTGGAGPFVVFPRYPNAGGSDCGGSPGNTTGISSCSRTSQGKYLVTFNFTYGALPTCNCTAIGGGYCAQDGVATTNFQTQLHDNTGALADEGFNLTCWGLRP